MVAGAGNRALCALLGVQRDEAAAPAGPGPTGGAGPQIAPRLLTANPFVDEHDPVTLANPRFAGNAKLERIATGQGQLSASDNGPAVSAVQHALVALGYSLLRSDADRRFGPETAGAIDVFRQDRAMPAGGLTSRALGELDSDAPAPGRQEEHYLEYERLFADGRLDVAIAVGYDEGKAHEWKLPELRAGLESRGFTPGLLGLDGSPVTYEADKTIQFPTATGPQTRTIKVVVRVEAPGDGAAARFGNALAETELTIYTGHARRGVGPDFDPDKSAKENFIIGVGSALHAAGRATEPSAVEQHHYVTDRVNDLEAMTASGRLDQEKYRVWFFNACTSVAYFDELRGGILPPSMDRRNLDLFATRKPVRTIAGVATSLAMLDGVMAASTAEQITRGMETAAIARITQDAPGDAAVARDAASAASGAYGSEGMGDNDVAAP